MKCSICHKEVEALTTFSNQFCDWKLPELIRIEQYQDCNEYCDPCLEDVEVRRSNKEFWGKDV